MMAVGKNKKTDEFTQMVEELGEVAEEVFPRETEIYALARRETTAIYPSADTSLEEIQELRLSVTANAHYLDEATAREFNIVILNAPYKTFQFRIGLLKVLTFDQKKRLSRILEVFSVAAFKFVVLEKNFFNELFEQAYSSGQAIRHNTLTRQFRERIRQEKKWGYDESGKKTAAEEEAEKKGSSSSSAAASSQQTLAEIAGQRHDISDLTKYYELLEALETGKIREDEIDTFRLVSFYLQDFILSGASDLHIHAARSGGRVRYRYQGTPYTRFSGIPAHRYRQIVNSFCTLAGKDPARMIRDKVESVIKLRINLEGEVKDVEFRFEALPSLHSPSINLRGQPKPLRDLNKVGFLENQLRDVEHAASRERGVVVVTGPTGSGKTNTLNAIFARLEEPDDKVIIELGSPIEIESDRRVQITIPDTPTEKEQDLLYQKFFKACLRFDPDVVAFTEIRSSDEAKIAFRAANSGHLVFTTLHAADVEETFGTIFNWQIERSIISKGILAIIAQTLIQKLCPNCRIVDEDASAMAGTEIWRENETGCELCENGFAGRTVVAEVLLFNDHVRQMINEGQKPAEIVGTAVECGYLMPMKRVALQKLQDGVTSESEICQLVELKTAMNSEMEEITFEYEENFYGNSAADAGGGAADEREIIEVLYE